MEEKFSSPETRARRQSNRSEITPAFTAENIGRKTLRIEAENHVETPFKARFSSAFHRFKRNHLASTSN
jgi:hypothetical protein